MSSLFDSGIIPAINQHLTDEAAKERDYGDYWSASSAGYCNRRVIFERLKVPHTSIDERKQRIFSAGHIFHSWMQGITREAGISRVQELELQDEELMIRGHLDDIVVVNEKPILYDLKTAHGKWFEYAKTKPVSFYNKMQVGTYMYMVRKLQAEAVKPKELADLPLIDESRILKLSKDDLRLFEYQVLWDEILELRITAYWEKLNAYWDKYQLNGSLPPCSCHEHENGFLAKEAWNPFFKYGQPCSEQYFNEWRKENDTASMGDTPTKDA